MLQILKNWFRVNCDRYDQNTDGNVEELRTIRDRLLCLEGERFQGTTWRLKGMNLKKTIIEAIKEVMLAAGQPMTVSEVYQAIVSKNLYTFKADQPVQIVRSQMALMGTDTSKLVSHTSM